MKKLLRLAVIALSFFAVVVIAGGMSKQMAFAFSTRTDTSSGHGVVMTVMPGSLKGNIQRMAKKAGWPTFVWAVNGDYTWVGKTKMHAQSFAGIMQQLLKDYPVQANFYQGNKVLAIVPRTLR